MPKTILKVLLLTLFVYAPVGHARIDKAVDAVLAREEAPAGVVFEVVTGDRDFLDQAIPAIREQSARLRERFKDLPIAVVSHGNEQFALLAMGAEQHANVHKEVKVMNLQDNIPVHVCGTYASWRGVDEEEFPEYVDVAPAGPVQIRNYVELGYLLIQVELD